MKKILLISLCTIILLNISINYVAYLEYINRRDISYNIFINYLETINIIILISFLIGVIAVETAEGKKYLFLWIYYVLIFIFLGWYFYGMLSSYPYRGSLLFILENFFFIGYIVIAKLVMKKKKNNKKDIL